VGGVGFFVGLDCLGFFSFFLGLDVRGVFLFEEGGVIGLRLTISSNGLFNNLSVP